MVNVAEDVSMPAGFGAQKNMKSEKNNETSNDLSTLRTHNDHNDHNRLEGEIFGESSTWLFDKFPPFQRRFRHKLKTTRIQHSSRAE
jgi:hypothetical protein